MKTQEEQSVHEAFKCAPITLSCQQCGHSETGKQYFSFTGNEKEILLKGDFFQWSCPKCGYFSELRYPCRYFDADKKLSVVLHPNIEEEEQAAEAMNQRLDGLQSQGFCHRAVGNFYAMQELVRIREEGLDDRVIQLIKPLIIGQMQADGKEVWNGYFSSIDRVQKEQTEKDLYIVNRASEIPEDTFLWFTIYMTDFQSEEMGINLNAYHLCENLLSSRGDAAEDGLFHHYDLGWAIGFHGQIREE